MATTVPTRNDILCGKDKTYSKHHGNQLFRAKIMSMTNEYRKAGSKPERMKLTRIIVDSLRTDYNARFLRSIASSSNDDISDVQWEEINDQQARDKTSHALRFALNKEDGSKSRRAKKHAKKQKMFKKNATIPANRRQYRRKSVGDLASTPTLFNHEDNDFGSLVASGPTVPTLSIPERTRTLRARKIHVLGNNNSTAKMDASIMCTRLQRHKRIDSNDSSDGTVGTTAVDSDAVSVNSSHSSISVDDDTPVPVVVVVLDPDDDDAPGSNNHQHSMYRRLSSSLSSLLQTQNKQGIQSSPGRLGGGDAGEAQRIDSFDDQEQDQQHHYYASSNDNYDANKWNIDQLDMTVRSDDLNDFLEEEISCDWNDDEDEDDDNCYDLDNVMDATFERTNVDDINRGKEEYRDLAEF